MHQSHVLYTRVIKTQSLESYLSLIEIANVYYNRSLNCTKISDYFFSSEGKESQPTSAHAYMEKAVTDMEKARSIYPSEADVNACTECLTEYQHSLSIIMTRLRSRVAAIPPLNADLFQAQAQSQDGATASSSMPMEPNN
ncbi:hypothetical protein DA717_13020 [Piscirickettsiaceae bacterium NZ-RLO2]|nr:hypothetical protein DA717_13020 [Piscirickettsiaceae bacterium NZ-RLO2]